VTVLLVIAGAIVGAAIVIARALLVDETKGRLRRRVTESVEATIASLPPELREEWAEEWRGDLEEVLSMPLTALLFARNVRVAARELAGAQDVVPALADARTSSWSSLRRVPARLQRSGWVRGLGGGARAAATFSRNAILGLSGWPLAVKLLGGFLIGSTLSLMSVTLVQSAIISVALALVGYLFDQRRGR
jgi:hypothetical protein